MKSFIIFIILINIAKCQFIVNSDTATIRSEYWSIWKKHGDITFGDQKINWMQKCSSISPYDIFFGNEKNNYSRTDGKLFSIGTKIKFRDVNKNVVGYMQEDIITTLFSLSIYSIFHLFDNMDTETAYSEKVELFSTDIKIYDKKTDKVIATIYQSFVNKLEQKFFTDGKMTITFLDESNYFTKNETRYITLMAATTKIVADMQRDKNGKITPSTCQSVNILLVVILPIIAVVGIIVLIYICIKKGNNCFTNCINRCCDRIGCNC